MDWGKMRPQDIAQRSNTVLLWLAEALLVLRVVLRLLSVDESVEVAKWVYQMSDPLLAPVRWFFPYPVMGDGVVLDMPAVFAMVAYAVFAVLVAMLVGRWARNK